MPTVSVVMRELRIQFLTASLLPVLVSSAVVRFETGRIDPVLLLLTLVGAALLHLGTNTANDYFDHRSGADALNRSFASPFTGGSRLIQRGEISPGAVLAISISCFAAALLVGTLLALMAGWPVILLGAVGLASGWFYTAPPLRIAHRGFGELTVGINFGFLIGIGTYYVQTGTVSAAAVAASLPLTLLVAGIIIINEFQDSESDGMAGKRTLVVRAGTARSVPMFGAVMVLAYLPVVAGVVSGLMPRTAAAVLLALPLAVRAVLVARARHDRPRELAQANALTIAAHAATGLLLAGAFLVSSP